MESEAAPVASRRIEALAKNEKVNALYSIAKNKRNKEHADAAEALGNIGSDAAVRLLLKLCQHEELLVWEPAKAAVAALKNPLAVPALLEAVAGEEYQLAVCALKALRQIPTFEALQGILDALQNENLLQDALAALKGRREPEVTVALDRLLQSQVTLQNEDPSPKTLLWSNSICKEVMTLLQELNTVPAMKVLHGFLRKHVQGQEIPLRLRILAAKQLCLIGQNGYYALCGYIGENLTDPQRLMVFAACLPCDDAVAVLLENMKDKAADELGSTINTCLTQCDAALWPYLIDILDKLNRESARSQLLLWFVRTKAACREAGFALAKHNDTNPILVKRLVDMVHKEEKDVRLRAGDLLHDLFTQKLIGEEGLMLVKASLDEDGKAEDYSYIGPT